MEKRNTINRVNVESLFATLYATGSAKLSDHFYSENDDERESDK